MGRAGKAAAACAAVAMAVGGTTAVGATSGSQSAPKNQKRTVHLRVRQTVTVKLPENPSTGYHWVTQRKPAKRVLRRTSAHFVPGPCPQGAVGCGGHEIFRYQAKGPGTTSLVLALMPPGSGAAAQTYRLTAKVR